MDMEVRVWEVAMVEAIITSPAWGDIMTMVINGYVRILTLNTTNTFKQATQNVHSKDV